MLETIGLILGIGVPIVGALIALHSFMRDNRAEHGKLLEGMSTITEDFKKSNEECRKELKEARVEFIATLKTLVGDKK